MANEESALSTAEVSVSLLPGSRVPRHQRGIQAEILSARKSRALAGSLRSESGKPR
jgi:hypothetical protein